MAQVYTVETDLNPDQLTAVAAETYRAWLDFSMGKGQIGGKTLAHPSGRYAASLSWRKTGVASIAIIADESIAPEAKWIEEGRAGTSMKAAMLGRGNTRISKDGYMYRVIPMRQDYKPPRLGADQISKLISTSATGQSLNASRRRMWGRPRKAVDQDRFRTMTNAPGSSPWIIDEFVPYAPGQILADLLRSKYGR